MTTITVHPPPPVPDKGTAKRLAVTRGDGDLGMTVALCAAGRQTMTLARAIANDPVRMVMLATKFPPKFLREMEDQTVMLGMGGSWIPSLGPTDAVRLQQGFLTARVSPATDARSERIRAFLAKSARQADAGQQEFDQVVTDF